MLTAILLLGIKTSTLKNFVRGHPNLLHLSRFILRRHSFRLEQFRSFSDAERDIDKWIKTFPMRYDLIIGIPRSGLYFASYIAIKLGLPLSTPDNFLRGETWFTKAVPMSIKFHNVLLLDDGVARFDGQMFDAFTKIKTAYPDLAITKAALYVYPEVAGAVDMFFGFLDSQKLNHEEWNIMHQKFGVTASDLDGVICHDWEPARYKSYDNFIENAEPYLIPRFKIDFIITSRPEKYREATLNWLNRNNVCFGQLLMMENQQHDITQSIRHKVQHLKKIRPSCYWENNLVEATEINRLTKIPVLYTDQMVLIK